MYTTDTQVLLNNFTAISLGSFPGRWLPGWACLIWRLLLCMIWSALLSSGVQWGTAQATATCAISAAQRGVELNKCKCSLCYLCSLLPTIWVPQPSTLFSCCLPQQPLLALTWSLVRQCTAEVIYKAWHFTRLSILHFHAWDSEDPCAGSQQLS